MSNFDKKAADWDTSSLRVQLAQSAYEGIKKEINLTKEMDIIDFGAGTGLLSRQIAPHVNSLLGVDSSQGMLEKLEELQIENIATCFGDFCDFETHKEYDGIVSSMTMHHIKDLGTLFDKMYSLLKEGGFIAIADLMSEDGTFHADNTGVEHFGFDEEVLVKIVRIHGFKEVKFQKIYEVKKEGKEPYGIFLLTAKK